jgi:hypothetical protein
MLKLCSAELLPILLTTDERYDGNTHASGSIQVAEISQFVPCTCESNRNIGVKH